MANQVKDMIAMVERLFPPHLAATWDNSGLQLGSYLAPAGRVGIALEVEPETAAAAIREEVDMIITHHPLFFRGIKQLRKDSAWGKIIYQLISKDIAVYAAHTNLDAAPQGLNQHLAEMLQLRDIEPLFADMEEELLKIAVYVPHSHVAAVQQAMAGAGAGHIGNYSSCSFRTPGIGSFLPQAGSKPFIGSAGVLQEVEEYRLETVIEKPSLKRLLQAMQSAHPYEEVAYDVYPLLNRGPVFSMGRKGRLSEPCALGDLARRIKKLFGCAGVRVVGGSLQAVQKVALISGSGGSLLSRLDPQLVDVAITGDVKYHEAQEARLKGINVIDAGHQELEKHMVPLVRQLLQTECEQQQLSIEVLELYAAPCFQYF